MEVSVQRSLRLFQRGQINNAVAWWQRLGRLKKTVEAGEIDFVRGSLYSTGYSTGFGRQGWSHDAGRPAGRGSNSSELTMNPIRWLKERVKTSLRYAMRQELERSMRVVAREEFDAGINRWLRDIDFGLRLRAILDSALFVQEHIPLHKRFDPFALRQRALELAPRDGLLLEFGVWKGMWINRLASWTDRQIYGFDSFEGLPEPWSFREKGHFAVDSLPVVRGNVTLVKGRFSESLPAFLQEHPEHIAFIHMDCDLYSSTKTVLDLIRDRLVPGTTIVLDDFLMEPGWQHQEHKAWLEFAKMNGIEFEYFGYQTSIACAVGVQILKVPGEK